MTTSSYCGWVENPFLDSLELSVRADRVLRMRGGVTNTQEFMALKREDVVQLKGAGTKTWQEVAQLQDYFSTPSLWHTKFRRLG